MVMDAGYVLAHVLEAVLPGHDLGDSPECEISLGGTVLQCLIPSTLQSENVALPTAGDPDPVVHVKAFDSQRQCIGLVVVPVSTLVPLEVWNVWYAMDEGEEDAEDKPPEETPKMHLLLQYVSQEAAAEETPQLREMRAQDFLLRALQQLNASLEAKVMVHQSRGPSAASPARATSGSQQQGLSASVPPPLPGGPSQLEMLSNSNALPVASGAFSAAPTPSDMAVGSLRPAGTAGSIASAAVQSHQSQSSTIPSSPQRYQQRGISVTTTAAEEAAKPPVPSQAQKAQWEDMMRARIEPYERVIAAFEEKQKVYEEEGGRIRDLTKSLEEAEAQCRAMHDQLEEARREHRTQVENERELARQAVIEKTSLEKPVVELRQELALRRAHEDSLQKRVALMESELSVVHQKCVIVDSVEEEASGLRKELQSIKEAKQQSQELLDEKGREVARLTEEAWKHREDHSKELVRTRNCAIQEQKASEQLRHELRRSQDLARDKGAEKQLLGEKNEELVRQVSTLENEATSYKGMLERERQHRKELELRLEEQELQRLNSVLDEHREIVRELREEVLTLRRDVQDERSRAGGMEAELAGAHKEMVKARQHADETRQKLVCQEELRQELQSTQSQIEEFRSRVKAMQGDTRSMAERYEREIVEHSKSSTTVCEERDQRQREVGELRTELAGAHQQHQELQFAQEATGRTLANAKEAEQRCQQLQDQLHRVQEECRSHGASRDKLHDELERLSEQLQHDAFAHDKRSGSLEEMLEERNNEIKLLMYRVQELSSKYTPVKGDTIDTVLSKWINGYRPAVPFFRLTQGLYLFGRRQVACKISNDKPVFRVGGGFIGFDKFLELYASEELQKLLIYEMDERSGDPKFLEAQKVRQEMEAAGVMDEHRERAAQSNSQAIRDMRVEGGYSAPGTFNGSRLIGERVGGPARRPSATRARSPSAGGC